MYQANALSDNISSALVLLAEKHLGFSVPTTDFIPIRGTHKIYLVVGIDNKLRFKQNIDRMSIKQTICSISFFVTFTCVQMKLKIQHIML